MKTKKTTRVSFSADGSTIRCQLPTSWSDLTGDELRKVYKVLSVIHCVPGRLEFAVFRALTGARMERRPDGQHQMRLAVGRHVRRCLVTPEEMAELLEPLTFLFSPGDRPVRLDWIVSSRYRAVNAQLHGISFGDYIRLENLYQGFLAGDHKESLAAIGDILYPGSGDKLHRFSVVDVFNIVQWMVQIKAMFAREFRNFFKPATGQQPQSSMLEVMNNEIRALTGGDVTKEEPVLEMDCWRALTELDYKAKEAEELKRQLDKSGK